MERIETDYVRYCQQLDMNSHLFLNRSRQKRFQWRIDDLKYREDYKHICHKKFMNYLQNVENLHRTKTTDLRLHNTNNNSVKLPSIYKENKTGNCLQTSNPYLSNSSSSAEKPFSNGVYSAYDKDFIQKLPGLIELVSTDVGKQYIRDKERQHIIIASQRGKFDQIQTNALKDRRYRYLLSSLIS
jgi:hypothetical protein